MHGYFSLSTKVLGQNSFDLAFIILKIDQVTGGLTGVANSNEESGVTSPRFDLSGFTTDPILSFKYWCASEPRYIKLVSCIVVEPNLAMMDLLYGYQLIQETIGYTIKMNRIVSPSVAAIDWSS